MKVISFIFFILGLILLLGCLVSIMIEDSVSVDKMNFVKLNFFGILAIACFVGVIAAKFVDIKALKKLVHWNKRE